MNRIAYVAAKSPEKRLVLELYAKVEESHPEATTTNTLNAKYTLMASKRLLWPLRKPRSRGRNAMPEKGKLLKEEERRCGSADIVV
jgi:hypothetical protein